MAPTSSTDTGTPGADLRAAARTRTATAMNELGAACAPLERLIPELEGRLRAQEQRSRDLRLLLLARGCLPVLPR